MSTKQMKVGYAFPVGIETSKTATLSHDIPNLAQIESLIQGNISHKEPVKVEVHANVDIATGGLFTQDGYAILDGDRVLLNTQTNPVENGIYVVSTGAWTRATDADEQSELKPHTTVVVTEGDHVGRVFTLDNNTSPVVGTDAQNWVLKNIIITSADEVSMSETNINNIQGDSSNTQKFADNVDASIGMIMSGVGGLADGMAATVGKDPSGNHLGQFAGSIIGDDKSVKDGMQDLETKLESIEGVANSANAQYNANKYQGSSIVLTSGVWNSITHSLNEEFVSSVQVFDNNDNKLHITDTMQWRPKAGDNNAIEIYQESGSTVNATVVVRK